MKIQTSLEFLIISGAIGALILGALLQYGSVFASGKGALNRTYGNYSVPNVSYHQRPYLEIAISPNSSAGEENNMQLAAYGCSNGTASISISSATATIYQGTINASFYGAATWDDGFYPAKGKNGINVTYGMRCAGAAYNGSYEFETFASGTQQPGGQAAYSAYIYARNESITYDAASQGIVSLQIFSHCTYASSFNYQPYDISGQCGTADAWQYDMFTNYCYDVSAGTLTTCIVPEPSGYNITTPNPYSARYSYSASLMLVGGNYSPMYSQISSSERNSSLSYYGKAVGSVYLYNVSSEDQPPVSSMITGSGSGYANSTYLSQYLQSLNNLYSVLGYYNSTGVTSAQGSQISEAISAYNLSEARLIGHLAVPAQGQCGLANGTFDCPAAYPFYYMLNVTAPPSYIYQNQTASYEGSIIRLST